MSKKAIYLVVALVVIIAIVVGGYFFITNNNQQASNIDLQQLNATISSKQPFNEMATMDITKEILTSYYEINAEDVEEVIGKMPAMNVHASMYLVIKVKEGSVDVVKEKVNQYAIAQEGVWERYLPEQYDLVKDRKLGTNGNYVYLFISENSSELEALMK